MADKSPRQDKTPTSEAPLNAITQLQEAGLGNMMAMGTAWIEAVNNLSVEVAHFIAERIKEDVKTQQDILHCKNLTDLQHIQAQFIQKAMGEYQAETSKLVEMGTKAFEPKEN